MTVPWTLEEALQIIRKIALIVHGCGLEVALCVRPVLTDHSSNDLDVLLFVEGSDTCSLESCLKDMRDHLPEVRAVGALQTVASERKATVWLHDGRHIDARFVVC
jgi:hypothetical protein